jgi:hypothetical protein
MHNRIPLFEIGMSNEEDKKMMNQDKMVSLMLVKYLKLATSLIVVGEAFFNSHIYACLLCKIRLNKKGCVFQIEFSSHPTKVSLYSLYL